MNLDLPGEVTLPMIEEEAREKSMRYGWMIQRIIIAGIRMHVRCIAC